MVTSALPVLLGKVALKACGSAGASARSRSTSCSVASGSISGTCARRAAHQSAEASWPAHAHKAINTSLPGSPSKLTHITPEVFALESDHNHALEGNSQNHVSVTSRRKEHSNREGRPHPCSWPHWQQQQNPAGSAACRQRWYPCPPIYLARGVPVLS